MESTYQAVVIDDNRHVHADFAAMVRTDPRLRNLNVVYYCKTVRQALRFLNRHGRVDVVFCDIELKNENGLHQADQFFRLTAFFLLISAYVHYKVEAWERGVHGYIVKPIDPEAIRKKLEDLDWIRRTGRVMDDPDRTVFIKDTERTESDRVRVGDIRSITVDYHDPNVLRVDTVSGTLKTRISLTSFRKKLSATGYVVQLDQSTLVSKLHVKAVDGVMITLDNGMVYAVSRRKKRALSELRDYLNMRHRTATPA